MNNCCLRDVLSKNRAEELGYDVWEHFVIPPFFDRLNLKTVRKPRVILGGRGCGKTMLLRYLSHQSVFSQTRDAIPDDAASHVGLYWRMDTQFSNAMMGRDIESEVWASAFNHYAALIIGKEFLESLESMAASRYEKITPKSLEELSFDRLRNFHPDFPSSLADLKRSLEDKVWAFEAWVNDVRKVEEPRFLPGDAFIRRLVGLAKQQLPSLEDAVFFVYVDEYENLCEYQQRIINTWLKHSEPPLVYNLAMKRHSFTTKRTTGKESLNKLHDYRQHDLEDFESPAEFQAFAAEILFLNLANAGLLPFALDTTMLKSPERLAERKEQQYTRTLIDQAKSVFPGLSQTELADHVFSQASLVNKLRGNIVTALKARGSDLSAESFLQSSCRTAMIIVPALLHRRSLKPEEVLNELQAVEAEEDNRFLGTTAWVHNNFVASVIQLFGPYSKTCPFYAGFEAFCKMSSGNIRHFLELCHQSCSRIADRLMEGSLVVDPLEQAEASKQASTTLLGEVRGFGRKGPQLLTFTHRLGSLFALAHSRKALSENEQTHFAITKGHRQFTAADEDFMREALKWSILFESESTKDKSEHHISESEFVLNPIYAPYFSISYRKKRRLELDLSDVITLIRGSIDEYSSLVRMYAKKWDIDSSDEEDLPLFRALEGGTGE